MEPSEVYQLVGRLRRTFPRHLDVLALCEVAEGFLTKREVVVRAKRTVEEDREAYRAYMRRYMREVYRPRLKARKS